MRRKLATPPTMSEKTVTYSDVLQATRLPEKSEPLEAMAAGALAQDKAGLTVPLETVLRDVPDKGIVEQAYEAQIETLTQLLRNLLKEVSMLDAMGLVNQFVCTGCVKKSPKAPKACVEARKYLDE